MQYFSTSEKPILGEIRAGLFKTAPTGWLMLDGSTFDKTKYPRLYALLGTNTLPNMGAATLSGKGGTLPADTDANTATAAADCDTGNLGEIVGENAQLTPKHEHGVVYNATGGNVNSVLAKTSSGTESGFCVSLTSGSGGALFTTERGAFSDKTYTDVRGRRLLVNFIIRAV